MTSQQGSGAVTDVERGQIYEVFVNLTRQGREQTAVDFLRSLAADEVPFSDITNASGNTLLVSSPRAPSCL